MKTGKSPLVRIERGLRVAARMSVDWIRTGQLRAPTAWSIGILRGHDLFALESSSHNPVITARQVRDVDAAFVADPFMIRRGSRWFMFFEVMNRGTRKGEIGLATSDEGQVWHYEGIVFSAPHHLSYPFVFASEGDVLMVPEESRRSVIRLFRAVDFPERWEPVQTIAEGMPFEDTTLFLAKGRWWAITTTTSGQGVETHIFHSERLGGPWVRHPGALNSESLGRSAGRVVEADGDLVRFVQESNRVYGESVHAYRIEAATPTAYVQSLMTDLPVVGPSGVGWNAARMHTLDPHRLESGEWIACVDGRGFSSLVTRLDRALPVAVRPYEYPRARE